MHTLLTMAHGRDDVFLGTLRTAAARTRKLRRDGPAGYSYSGSPVGERSTAIVAEFGAAVTGALGQKVER
ncbi:hypothetical protein V496_00656 [Pseudogymnoascus sp. VKM F-4515 (FW-2607)]|nr:hypothetical protein V496_00656 [Pseudogymnoascus sp. VKM F-4515 (FW-2607)]KFY97761.1 hypothetical protein V498_01884 [Pseudogymnoascus sp. VKM F-4517 (FW-2822)]